MNYYNDFDPKICAWARELIKAKLVPDGEVDCRSIADVEPNDLRGFTQCHFFCGILGWSRALQLAGWPSDRLVWSASLPCQPWSNAGKGLGAADERHLWPVFANLVRECNPSAIFGEQVSSPLGREWLVGVFADLEAMGYAAAGADLCSAGVGSPNIRQRIYWMADAHSQRHNGQHALLREDERGRNEGEVPETSKGSEVGGMADANGGRFSERNPQERRLPIPDQNGRLGEPNLPRSQGRVIGWDGEDQRTPWEASLVIECRDGKRRRISAEPEAFPLAARLQGRVAALHGIGNAINPVIAAQFILASQEAINAEA